MEEYSNAKNDKEFAALLWTAGKWSRDELNLMAALKYHNRSLEYDSTLAANYVGLMEGNYLQNNFMEALDFAMKLIDLEYPSRKKAYRIALDCALQAGLQKEQFELASEFILHWQDEDVKALHKELSGLVSADESP